MRCCGISTLSLWTHKVPGLSRNLTRNHFPRLFRARSVTFSTGGKGSSGSFWLGLSASSLLTFWRRSMSGMTGIPCWRCCCSKKVLIALSLCNLAGFNLIPLIKDGDSKWVWKCLILYVLLSCTSVTVYGPHHFACSFEEYPTGTAGLYSHTYWPTWNGLF